MDTLKQEGIIGDRLLTMNLNIFYPGSLDQLSQANYAIRCLIFLTMQLESRFDHGCIIRQNRTGYTVPTLYTTRITYYWSRETCSYQYHHKSYQSTHTITPASYCHNLCLSKARCAYFSEFSIIKL